MCLKFIYCFSNVIRLLLFLVHCIFWYYSIIRKRFHIAYYQKIKKSPNKFGALYSLIKKVKFN